MATLSTSITLAAIGKRPAEQSLSTSAPTNKRMFPSVDVNAPFPNVCFVDEGTLMELADEHQRKTVEHEGAPWPCLYAPSYEALVTELRSKTTLIPEETLTEIAWDHLNKVTSDANIDGETTPVLLSLKSNILVFDPPERQMMPFACGSSIALKKRQSYPELQEALVLARDINKECNLTKPNRMSFKSIKATTTSRLPASDSTTAKAPQEPPAHNAVGGKAAEGSGPKSDLQIAEENFRKYVRQVSPSDEAKQEKTSIPRETVRPYSSYVNSSLIASPQAKASPKEAPVVEKPEGLEEKNAVTLGAAAKTIIKNSEATSQNVEQVNKDRKQPPSAEAPKTTEKANDEVVTDVPLEEAPTQSKASESEQKPSSDPSTRPTKAAEGSESTEIFKESAKLASTDNGGHNAPPAAKGTVAAEASNKEASEVEALKNESEPSSVELENKEMPQEETKASADETVATMEVDKGTDDAATSGEEQGVEGKESTAPQSSNNDKKVGNEHVGSAKKASPKDTTKTIKTPPSALKEKTFFVDEEDRPIPKFKDVKKTLQNMGFVFHIQKMRQYYCFPGKDPRSSYNLKEGEDYFTSEDSFRAYLCAHGVGDVDFPEDSVSYQPLQRWIRFSIVKSIGKRTKLPDKYVGTPKFWTLLGLLGMSYDNNGYYLKDGTRFAVEGEFINHISRFGLPADCEFDSITKDQRLQLELHFANMKCDTPPSSERSTRKRRGNASTSQNNDAKKSKTTKSAANEQATSSRLPSAARSTPESYDSQAWNTVTQNPPGQPKTKKLKGRNIAAEMQDEPSESQKLSQCLEKLNSSNADEGGNLTLGSADSRYRKNITDVYYTLEALVKSRVLDSLSEPSVSSASQPAAIYVAGVPGTGKTSGLQWCCNKIAKEFTDGPWRNQNIEPVVADLNAAHLASSGSDNIRKELFDKIWSKCNDVKSKMTEKALLKSLQKTVRANEKKRFVILVLDEIDHLVMEKSNSTNAVTAPEKLLKELNSWSTNPEFRFALIGIGNSLNNPRRRRVQQFVKFKKDYMFSAYSKEDMIEIMQARIGKTIVDPNALKFIAGKIANNSGDVRQAIEMVKTAIKTAQEKLQNQPKSDEQKPESDKGSYIVKMRDVVKMNPDYLKCSEMIADLPSQGKIIVSVVVDLVKKNHFGGSMVALTRRDLKRASLDALHRKNPNDQIPPEDVNDLIERLDDTGMMKVTHHRYDMDKDEFLCNYQAQELELALEEALGDNDFLRGFA